MPLIEVSMAVNGPRWHTRGPSMARQALAAWFRDDRARKKARASAKVQGKAKATQPTERSAPKAAKKKSAATAPPQG